MATGLRSRFWRSLSARSGWDVARVVRRSLLRSLLLGLKVLRKRVLPLLLMLLFAWSTSSPVEALTSMRSAQHSRHLLLTPPDWGTDGPCDTLATETMTVQEFALCKLQHDANQSRRETTGLLWLIAVCAVASCVYSLAKPRK